MSMLENTDKIFFAPGDLVTIKHDMPNKPIMLVKGKETKMVKDENYFKGIRCLWFTSEGAYQEETFSTKDLTHLSVDGSVTSLNMSITKNKEK